MKYVIFATILLFSPYNLKAQDILAYYGWTTYHTVRIFDNFSKFHDIFCNKTFVHGNLAYQQHGTLYTTWTHSGMTGTGSITNLKSFDLINCDTLQISRIQGKHNSSFYFIFVDYNGKLYFAADLDRKKAIFRSNADFTDLDTLLALEKLGNPIIDDLVILGDKLLALNPNLNEIYEIDTSFNILSVIRPAYKVTGLTTKYNNCKDKRLIVSAYPYSHAVWDSLFQLPNDRLSDTLNLYEFDYVNNQFYPLAQHIYPHGQEANLNSLTSFDDILSSDPECTFLLDLDRNNSSGVVPYDFKQVKQVCRTGPIPIVDDDVYVESDLQVDSVQLKISGLQDGLFEKLIVADTAYASDLFRRSDTLYSIVFKSRHSVMQLQDLLKQLFYVHEGILLRTEGKRVVQLEVFAENAIKRKANCFIHVGALTRIYRDTLLCYNDTLVDAMGIMRVPGDTWVQYEGISVEGCDSVEIWQLNAFPITTFRITGDTMLCKGKSIELCIANGQDQRWSTGDTTACIQVTQSKEYTATVRDRNLCKYPLAYQVTDAPQISYTIDVDPVRCHGEQNGEIHIRANAEIKEYFLEQLTNSTGRFDHLEAGSYIVGFYDKHHCLYTDTLVVSEPDDIEIIYEDTLVVKDRISEELLIHDVHQILAEIEIQPWQGIHKLGAWKFALNPDQGGNFKIVATDTNGCVKEYPLYILLDLNDQLYYPNVFSPNADGVNDLWNIHMGSAYTAVSLHVYDRWGAQIYAMPPSEIGNLKHGWNGQYQGKNCPPGVYVFQALLWDDKNQSTTKYGNFTLLR